MNYLQKKILKRFLLVLFGSLFLAWINGRPIPIKGKGQILGTECNDDLKIHKVINDHLNLKNSNTFLKLKEILNSDSFDDFSDKLFVKRYMLDFDYKAILKDKVFRKNLERSGSEFKQVVTLFNTGSISNKMISENSESMKVKVNYSAIFGMLLNEAFFSWDDDKSWSLKCLNASRKIISNLSENHKQSTVEYASIFNVIYNRVLLHLVNTKDVEVDDLQRFIQISKDNEFKLSTKILFEINRAEQKYKTYKLVRTPENTQFESSIKIRLKTYTFEMSSVFKDIDELYLKVNGAIEKEDWVAKAEDILKNLPPPKSSAFAFLTENAEKKRALNNWLLMQVSRIVLRNQLNSYQNINYLGRGVDSIFHEILRLKLINKIDNSINEEILSELDEIQGFKVNFKKGVFNAEIKFDYQAIEGVFAELPKSFKFEMKLIDGL